MNNVNLIGRVSCDLDLRYSGDSAVVRFGLAVNSFKKDENGNYITNFYNIVAWNKTAENICKMSSKGKRVAISGYLDINKYQDKNGNNRQDVLVIANTIDFLDTNTDNSNSQNRSEYNTSSLPQRNNEPYDEDTPF